MSKFPLIFLLTLILALPAWAQQEEAAEQATDTEEAASGAAGVGEAGEVTDEEEIDDSDLDEQTYEADDDDFVPTEEIPADEPIPFPSNI